MTYASETVSQETVQEIENNSYTDLKDMDDINSEDETKETEETEQTKEIPESDDSGIVPYSERSKGKDNS